MATRNYAMRARADEVESRRSAILQAMFALSMEKLTVNITLDDVAERAGVSVRTVLRQFGSWDGLFAAALEAGKAEILKDRDAPAGDITGAIRGLVNDYEIRGDWGFRMLAQEDDPRIGVVVANGRTMHREWVARAFAPYLPKARDEQERLTDLLVVATDVVSWKLLRRDRGLDRLTTEARMRDLVTAVLNMNHTTSKE